MQLNDEFDVYEKIKESAKLRLDWFEFENRLIDYMGTDNGAQIANNILGDILGELSLGKTKDQVNADLNNELLGIGLQADLDDFIAVVKKECKAEISAIIYLRAMKNSTCADNIYILLKPNLLSFSDMNTDMPSDEEKQCIRSRLLEPIIRSAKTKFDYAVLAKKATQKDPVNGEKLIDLVFNILFTDRFLEMEEPKEIIGLAEKIINNNSCSSWICDLVNMTLENCKKERNAMLAVNIGLCKHLSIDEIEELVNMRLNK